MCTGAFIYADDIYADDIYADDIYADDIDSTISRKHKSHIKK